MTTIALMHAYRGLILRSLICAKNTTSAVSFYLHIPTSHPAFEHPPSTVCDQHFTVHNPHLTVHIQPTAQCIQYGVNQYDAIITNMAAHCSMMSIFIGLYHPFVRFYKKELKAKCEGGTWK